MSDSGCYRKPGIPRKQIGGALATSRDLSRPTLIRGSFLAHFSAQPYAHLGIDSAPAMACSSTDSVRERLKRIFQDRLITVCQRKRAAAHGWMCAALDCFGV